MPPEPGHAPPGDPTPSEAAGAPSAEDNAPLRPHPDPAAPVSTSARPSYSKLGAAAVAGGAVGAVLGGPVGLALGLKAGALAGFLGGSVAAGGVVANRSGDGGDDAPAPSSSSSLAARARAAMPGLPAMPAMPAMPAVPALPDMPALPLPSLPSLPPLPDPPAWLSGPSRWRKASESGDETGEADAGAVREAGDAFYRLPPP